MGVIEGRDALEGRFQRLESLLLNQVGVHAGGKEVAILLFQRALGMAGRRIQLLPEQIAVALAEQRKRPRPARLVSGNGIALDPVAAGVLVKIRAGIGCLVNGRRIEALDGRGWRGLRGIRRLRHRRRRSQNQNWCETKIIHQISSWVQDNRPSPSLPRAQVNRPYANSSCSIVSLRIAADFTRALCSLGGRVTCKTRSTPF